MSTFSERIKEIRKDNKLTLVNMGEIAGVSSRQIGNYEAGKALPKDDVIERICEALGLNKIWLKDGTGDKAAETQKPAKKKASSEKKEAEQVQEPAETEAEAVKEEAAAAEEVREEKKEEKPKASGRKKKAPAKAEPEVEAVSEKAEEEVKEEPAVKPEKEEEKPAAPKKAESKAKGRKAAKIANAPTIMIQSQSGGQISTDVILRRVLAAAPDAEAIYVKSEENKAYWVSKKANGSVLLWDPSVGSFN
ncbi:MAG: helix-turn-helix transcriptional regulator [Blautia sp.]|nr:helix-turn-helix transcriptional regulator [Blautia sp.]